MRPKLTEIPGELAKPFIDAYVEKWNLDSNDDGFEEVQWYGAWLDSTLHAVVGLKPDLEGLFVYGFYGDGSVHENRALLALSQVLDAVPFPLTGNIILPNEKMLAAAVKRQWFVHNPEVDICVYVVRKEVTV
jgi:hypothetical protein